MRAFIPLGFADRGGPPDEPGSLFPHVEVHAPLRLSDPPAPA